MRGVKAVLYVAVLVCLISSSFAACTNGKTSPVDATQCVCQSGYYLDQQCTAFGALGSCQTAALSRTEANHFPSLSTSTGATSFVANTLSAIIEAEYVAKRQYEELTFASSTDNKCSLGQTASFWGPTTHANGVATSCNDSFTLTMPWSSHRDCGFANNTKLSNGDYMYITGYLHIKYTDDLGEVENFTLTRSTKVPYSITVRFQRHVTVDLKALNVSSDVKYGMALTEDVYDPTVQILTLELTTIVNWPNMFYQGNDQMIMYLPGQVALLQVNGAGALCTDAGAACTSDPNAAIFTNAQTPDCPSDTQDSICKQTFTWKAMIKTNAIKNCTFDGEYDLEIGLFTCRAASTGSPPDCTNQRINITYTIQDSFVCGEIGVTPSVSGDLYAFPPTVTSGFRGLVDAHQNINQFSLGTYGNFYAKIDSDDNVISIKFTRISFKVQGSNTVTDLFVSGAGGSQSQYIVVNHNSKYFNVYFHSSVFKVNPNSQVVYTFTASADVSFQGNDGFVAPTESKKRSVEFTWTQASAEASTNVFMAPAGTVADVQPASTSAGVSSVTFIASVVGAVAGTMIIVFVVVGFALRARSNKDEVSASLLAASAAASEVANRA